MISSFGTRTAKGTQPSANLSNGRSPTAYGQDSMPEAIYHLTDTYHTLPPSQATFQEVQLGPLCTSLWLLKVLCCCRPSWRALWPGPLLRHGQWSPVRSRAPSLLRSSLLDREVELPSWALGAWGFDAVLCAHCLLSYQDWRPMGERILGPRGQCHHTGGGRLPQARAATQLIQPPLRLSSEVTGWRREVTGNLPASAGYL